MVIPFLDVRFINHVGGEQVKAAARVHAVNAIILFQSSTGQRVVSVSGAETEFHGLVNGATDGKVLRLCLGFLMEARITHIFLIDSSAAKQVARKRGNGRRRYVSGTLLFGRRTKQTRRLWRSNKLEQRTMLATLARPLGKNFYAFMAWCSLHDKDGDPIGEEDAMKIKKAQVNKTKIIRVAQFLQTMVLT